MSGGTMAVGPRSIPGIVRKLASSDKGTREKAVALLELWLPGQLEIPEDELKKIWKGLFYCVWHADKAPVQAELIERLACLLEKVEVEVSVSFFKVFFSTMRREWGGIDRLRLDKFYLLLRKFLSHTFEVLDKGEWDKRLVSRFMDALEERAFLAKDRFPALGVNLHLIDIFWDEFRKYLPVPDGTLDLLLKPFYSILATSSDKALLKRVRENIFDHISGDARSLICMVEKEQILGGVAGNIGVLLISTPVAPLLFDLASAPSTSQANRKLLYELNEEFSKLAKSFDSLKGSTFLQELNRTRASLPNGTAAGKTENGGSRTRSKKRQAKGIILPIEEFGDSKVKKSKKMKIEQAPENGGSLEDSQADVTEENGQDRKVKEKRNRQVSMGDAKTGRPVLKKESLKRKAKKRKKAQPIEPEADGSDRVLGTNGHQNNGAQAPVVDSVGTVNGFEGINEVTMNLENKFDVVAGDELAVALATVSLGPRLKRNRKVLKKETVATKSTTRSGLPNGTETLPVSSPAPESKLEANVDGQTTPSPSAKKKKTKKVRFVLKNNLICKKGAPLPPLSLRTPPSATPRGSALKPGVQPGPIRTRPLRIARGVSRAKLRKRASRQLLTMSMQKPKSATRKLRKRPNL